MDPTPRGDKHSNNTFRSFVIAKLLRASLGDFQHVITRKAGEATALSRAALQAAGADGGARRRGKAEGVV
jgi:hypothetical protein